MEWSINENKELNKGFQPCAAFLLQLILESIKFTLSGGEGKGTEQVRLVLPMGIANSEILCPLKGTVFLTNQVVIG